MDCLSYQISRELLLKIASGDEAAFSTLFNRYRKKIYSFALSFTRSEFLAEEMVQEVFYKVWVNRKELSDIEFPEAWMKTIARNTASNYLKRLAHEKLIFSEMRAQHPGNEETTRQDVEWKEYHSALQRAIESLSPQQKRAYLLSRREGFKYQEIAEEMQLSIHTVKEYIKKALHIIREQLAPYAVPIILATYLLPSS